LDGDDVVADLDRRLEMARDAGRVASQLSILVQRAAALSRLHPETAPDALIEAITLAHPRGLRRVFLDEGRPIARLLQATAPRLTDRAVAAFAGGLLRAFPSAMVDALALDGVPLTEPLSPQERRVLRFLAAGLSNADIARELVVSPNTIKTQLQSLYRKLAVGNRQDAVTAARELDLL
jgi:LuxR family maltose regulon positive regulatory protein